MELSLFLMFIGGHSNVVDPICLSSFRRRRRRLLFGNREVADFAGDCLMFFPVGNLLSARSVLHLVGYG